MAQTVLRSPEPVLFRTELAVRVGDLNYGNHLANDAVLRLVHEARVRWLAAGGFSETDVLGVGLIMNRAEVHYLAQAFFGDVLRIDCGIAAWSRTGFVFRAALLRQSDGKTVALADCSMVFFDYAKQKVARMPQGFQAWAEKTVG
ncbi:MAG: thioesterase family protein [Neisseria sp.]|nr:thioesterase family protein [Neisseria sp.]